MTFDIQQDISLKPFNSFGFDYRAEFFYELAHLNELNGILDWLEEQQCALTIIGGGSNLVLQGDLSGLVLLIRNKGIQFLQGKTDDTVLLELAAGETWHDVVSLSVEHDLYGIENLALIPGTVGAAPVQNIGAYGVELKDVLHQIQVYDRLERCFQWIDRSDCDFGYRESRFKHDWKERYIITSLTIELSKKPNVQTSYKGLGEFNPNQRLTAKAIFTRVCDVRSSKLPDPKQLGNAGSYFKNPIVSQDLKNRILQDYPEVVAYPVDHKWKLAAGWLIEKAGWKGVRSEGVGVYDKQALVLVNYEASTAEPLILLQNRIVDDIQQKYGVKLEREPILLG